jgi:putative phosphoesterase
LKIAVFSDIHDNIWALDTALRSARREAQALICCGDLCSPFIIGLLKAGFPGRIFVVFGNNDADLYRITRGEEKGRLDLLGELGELALEGENLLTRAEWEAAHSGQDYFATDGIQRIAFQHFDFIARPLAASGKYHSLFYGHNHLARRETIGSIECINPGALMGYLPTHPDPTARQIPATYIIYNPSDRGVRWFTAQDRRGLPTESAVEISGPAPQGGFSV